MLINGKVYRQTFHTTNSPIARRRWKCSLCHGWIDKGERYVRYTWRQDTKIDDLPYHAECWAIVKNYCKRNNTNVYTNEEVFDWIKHRRHCAGCKVHYCMPRRCEKTLNFVKFKPLLTYWDKLQPMRDEEPPAPKELGYKVLDE